MTRDEVVIEARKWLRVPYRNKGRDIAGLDCIGFLVVVGRAFGITCNDTLDYSNWPAQDHRILRELARYLTPMPPSSPKHGLIGAFAQHRLPCHVGIFSTKHGAEHVIHATMRLGIRNICEEPWQHVPRGEMRLLALFGLPGLEP